jgi:hypothetical protein
MDFTMDSLAIKDKNNKSRDSLRLPKAAHLTRADKAERECAFGNKGMAV